MKVILNNWLAKLLSLVLAVILWLAIHQKLAPTGLPSNPLIELNKPSEGKINFSSNGSPKK